MRIWSWLLLAPALLLTVGLYGTGLGLAMLRTTPADYLGILRSGLMWRSFTLTLGLALAITGLAVVGGLGLALLLRRCGSLTLWLCQVTLPLPHLVGVTGMMMLLAPGGWLARLGVGLGWLARDQDWPLLVNDPGYRGVVLHWLWKEIPFVALLCLTRLQALGDSYRQQASLLGANPWQCFVAITLPLLAPTLTGAGIMVFAAVLTVLEVPFLLGPAAPPLVPVLIYRHFTATDLTERSLALSLGILLTLILGVVVFWGQRSKGGELT
ncbi:MAG: ABC transporter permease subunit [Thermostichales cyanobacterium BF4_bins_65]